MIDTALVANDSPMWAVLADKIPAALAVVLVVWMFLRYVERKEERNAKAFAEKDEMFERVMARAFEGEDRRRRDSQ